MRHRIHLFNLKAYRHRNIAFWAILSVSVVLLVLLWLFLSSASSIDHKAALITDNVSAINTEVGNISVADNPNLAKEQLSYIHSSLQSTEESIETTSFPSLSIWERLLHPAASKSFSETLDTTRAYFSSELLPSVIALRSTMDSSYKFLNYAPYEDFSQYGVDSIQDQERIAKTREALRQVSQDENLDSKSRTRLAKSLLSLESIESTGTIDTFAADIGVAQQAIYDNIRLEISTLKNILSEFYSTLLYQ